MVNDKPVYTNNLGRLSKAPDMINWVFINSFLIGYRIIVAFPINKAEFLLNYYSQK